MMAERRNALGNYKLVTKLKVGMNTVDPHPPGVLIDY